MQTEPMLFLCVTHQVLRCSMLWCQYVLMSRYICFAVDNLQNEGTSSSTRPRGPVADSITFELATSQL